MRKKILLISILFLLTGCTNINSLDTVDCIDTITKSDISIYNVNKVGYRFYIPRGFKIIDDNEYNETIIGDNYKYYMYVDIVSFYNRTRPEFESDSSAYLSKEISNRNGYGYIEINKQDNKFFIEMMYNYAKIEVLVDEKDIKSSVTNMSYILSSIRYNKNVIENMLDDGMLDFKEKTYKITKPKKQTETKNILDYAEEYDKYNDANEKIEDTDMING